MFGALRSALSSMTPKPFAACDFLIVSRNEIQSWALGGDLEESVAVPLFSVERFHLRPVTWIFHPLMCFIYVP